MGGGYYGLLGVCMVQGLGFWVLGYCPNNGESIGKRTFKIRWKLDSCRGASGLGG